MSNINKTIKFSTLLSIGLHKLSLAFLMLFVSSTFVTGQIVINEVLPGGTVEIKNNGTTEVDISNYWLCDFPAYEQINSLNIIAGDAVLSPGEIMAIDDFNFVVVVVDRRQA